MKVETSRRCPSHDIPLATHGLWSLWEMLDRFAWLIVKGIDLLQGLRLQLESSDELTSPELNKLNPQTATDGILAMMAGLADELDLVSTKRQITNLRQVSAQRLPKQYFIDALVELEVRLREDLSQKDFLFMPRELASYWQKKDAFALGVKFQAAHADIEAAGNCLAVGQGTACVLHLDRAMEVVLRKLATANNIQVTIGPRDTWGSILNKMTPKIEKMPENTKRLKDKKQAWSEARTHLFHIKECWRDRPAHGHETYSPARAKEIFEAVRIFMTHFATL